MKKRKRRSRNEENKVVSGYFNFFLSNMIENSIRPVALGGKKYLLAGSHDSARQATMIKYLVATYKINQAEPFAWLKQTLDEIPGQKVNKRHELLPAKLW